MNTIHQICWSGNFLNMVRGINGSTCWEYASRRNCKDVVIMIGLVQEGIRGKIVLVEQNRVPTGQTIELPGGLVDPQESLVDAAKRELLEETGYAASNAFEIIRGPVSPGLTDEEVQFVFCTGLVKQTDGGGIDNEKIIVHEIPLEDVFFWLQKKSSEENYKIDVKIYTGLLFVLAHEGKIEGWNCF